MTTGFPVSPLTPSTFLLVGLAGVDLADHQRRTIRYAFAVTLIMTVTALATGAIGTGRVAAAIPCEAVMFADLNVEGLAVRSVERVPAGGFTPPGASAPFATLPPFCRVRAVVATSDDSRVEFEVWSPEGWNGKLVSTGNGGYSNVPNYRDMAHALGQGYATVGGDTGHQTPTPDDLLWGAGHTERIVDWGTRSIHATLGPARRLVERAQGRAPRRAYFYGCSTGGHQAFAEMQRYPDDFDGVVAGAPAHNRVRLTASFLWQFQANHRRADQSLILPAAKLPTITRAVLAACDAADGAADGVLEDPRTCRFDPASLRCPAGDEPSCLTGEQVEVVKKMYDGPRHPRTGEAVYPGWPRGSEALTLPDGAAPEAGWHQYWGTTEPARLAFWRQWVFAEPAWDPWSFDFDRDVARADEKVGRLVDQVSADLGEFAKRGGKAIVYHGWQDPVVNALDTIAYYERLRARQGSPRDTDRFFRLFLVPGMGHCGGGPGATHFGNMFSPAPVVDPEHDLLSALDAWLEARTPPDRIVASRVVDGAPVATRLLCPYPRRAVYAGSGRRDDAARYVCRQDGRVGRLTPLPAPPSPAARPACSPAAPPRRRAGGSAGACGRGPRRAAYPC
jgi:feruloyl esterase